MIGTAPGATPKSQQKQFIEDVKSCGGGIADESHIAAWRIVLMSMPLHGIGG